MEVLHFTYDFIYLGIKEIPNINKIPWLAMLRHILNNYFYQLIGSCIFFIIMPIVIDYVNNSLLKNIFRLINLIIAYKSFRYLFTQWRVEKQREANYQQWLRNIPYDKA